MDSHNLNIICITYGNFFVGRITVLRFIWGWWNFRDVGQYYIVHNFFMKCDIESHNDKINEPVAFHYNYIIGMIVWKQFLCIYN